MSGKATTDQTNKAREMRRLGYSKSEIARACGKSLNWPERYIKGVPIDCEAAARRLHREEGFTNWQEIAKILAHRMQSTTQMVDEGAVKRGLTPRAPDQMDEA